MKTLLTLAFALVIGTVASQFVSAQQVDYVAYVERLAAEAGQRANQHAYKAIQMYRQQSGDYSTPDQQVLNYLIAQSRRQNPAFYQQLQQREQAFQQQQSAYRQYANSMLDNSHNNYMQRSNRQYQQHKRYVREGIHGQSTYTDPDTGKTYELPHYAGGKIFRAQDGSMFIQDRSGQYYRYDNNGWRTNMNYSGR